MSLFLIAADLHFVYTISHKTDAYCLAALQCSITKAGVRAGGCVRTTHVVACFFSGQGVAT